MFQFGSRRSSANALDAVYLNDELNKSREDALEKALIIEQLNSEQVVTRKLLLELQHLVTGQSESIGNDEFPVATANGSVTNGSSKVPNDHVFSKLRKLFDHHKECDQGFKEAMEKNAEMQLELEKYRAAVEYKKDGTLGRRKDKLAKLQAEELKSTIAKNEALEKELKELKKELLLMSENEMASDVLNQGTVNAKNEFRIDPKDLELHMEKRYNFESTKVGENTERRRLPRASRKNRSRIFSLVRLLRTL